jgi:hypothetical protein
MHAYTYIHTHTHTHTYTDRTERHTQSLSRPPTHTHTRSRSRALPRTHAANFSGMIRAQKTNSFRFLFHETRRTLYLARSHSLSLSRSLSLSLSLSLSFSLSLSLIHTANFKKNVFLLFFCFVQALSLELSAAFPVNRLGKQKKIF